MTGVAEELDNGVVVYRATDEKQDADNIYCERCYCSSDGKRFVYARHFRENGITRVEYATCDFETWEKRSLIGPEETGISSCEMANGDHFYYLRDGKHRAGEIVGVNLITGERHIIELPEHLPGRIGIALSVGERYLAYSSTVSYSPQLFAVNLLDLHTGKVERIIEDPYLCNTHLQFDPGEGRHLMVQNNRGCEFTPEGKRVKLAGEQGATLFFLEIPSGKVIRPLIGPPHTYGISGHETWMGLSGEAILTLNTTSDYDFGKGPILVVQPETGAVREVCAPYQANHIGVDKDGRLFAGESREPDDIVLGCPGTGKTVSVCPARTRYTRAAYEPEVCLTDHHPHAYVSADCKWVIFNSDREGVQQVYVARVPDNMVADLER